VLDCCGLVDHGVNGAGGNNPKQKVGFGLIRLENLTVLNSKFDAIYTKYRLSNIPWLISKCRVQNSGNRGIWLHVTSNVHVFENIVENSCNHDGIDVDAFASACTVFFNECYGNKRHGIFVEEAAANHVIIGNILSNNGNGITVWNEAVKGATKDNIMAFNKSSFNSVGIYVGGRSPEKVANNNLFFNNSCHSNTRHGIVTGNQNSSNNYFALCSAYNTVSGNPDMIQWGTTPMLHYSAYWREK
jgi:parallel beta-helix repeat protein